MAEIFQPKSFLDLPTEICIQVLYELKWDQLLVAQRISKTFQALIQTSKIQYRISLGIHGLEDGPDSHPMSVAERFKSLQALQNAFSRLDFSTKAHVDLSGYTPTYELQGGVFLQGRHPPGAYNETIGVNGWSFHNPTTPYAWRLPDFRRPIRDLTLDASQDLLVLIEGGHRDNPLKLHFLSLATGEIHPLVKGILKCPDYGHPDKGFVVTISGDFVALLGVRICFFICNWKTGRLHVDLDLSEGWIDDFFFLDYEKFVLIRTDENPGKLEVYTLNKDQEKPFEETMVAVYHLPLLYDDVVLESVQSRSDPAPQGDFSYISGPIYNTKPYSVRLEDRIIILTLAMHCPEGHRILNLMVRAETLTNIPEAARRTDGPAIVTSTMWMRQTRMLPNLVPPEQWMCYCYGSRMVTFIESNLGPGEETRGGMRIKPSILDFNPRLSAWVDAGKSGAPSDPGLPRRMHKGSDARFLQDVGRTDAFLAEDWISGLPFVLVNSPDSHIYDMNVGENVVLMIDDQRLIVLKMVRNPRLGVREPHYMDIYTP